MKKKIHVLENVAILATTHNVAKAYIARMYAEGLKPANVIYMKRINRISVFKKIRFVLKKYSISKFLKKYFKNRKKYKAQEQNTLNEIIETINFELKDKGIFSVDFDRSTKSLLKEYDWNFTEIEVNSINDPKLVKFLKNSIKEKYVVFTGGGILRKGMLGLGKKFIHVHPGVVPEIKGSDCLLWSVLLQNRIGMSTIILNYGIDTGDIINTGHYNIPGFNIKIESLPKSVIKDIFINYVDPHYRAQQLIENFSKELDPSKWITSTQNLKNGRQYYIMHDDILPFAINKFKI